MFERDFDLSGYAGLLGRKIIAADSVSRLN
jgi:hypothetical protein